MAGGDINVKHLWIQGGSGSPANVSETTPEYPGQLGKIGTIKPAANLVPRVLQFVQRKSSDTTVAAAQYNVAYWSDQDSFEIVADQTLAIGGSTVPLPAGVFLGTNPQAGSYGFIQVGGSTAVDQGGAADDNVAAGDGIFVLGGNSDGKVQCAPYDQAATTTVTTANVVAVVNVFRQYEIGRALEAETDSTVTVNVLLTLPRNGW